MPFSLIEVNMQDMRRLTNLWPYTSRVNLSAAYRQQVATPTTEEASVTSPPSITSSNRSGITRLDKLIESISSYFGFDNAEVAGLERVKSCLS